MKTLRTFRALALLIMMGGMLLPVSVSAATTSTSAKPVCLMTTTVINGETALLWASANTTTAWDESDTKVTTVGYRFVTPVKTTTYDYRFTGAGGNTSCDATVRVEATHTSGPTVTTVSSAKSATSTSSSKSKKSSSKSAIKTDPGTLSASMFAFLTGGTTRAGASVPVVYLKLSNPGTATTSIEGITLTQNGSASAAAITSFALSDDKGGSRATISGGFSGNSAYLPLAATFAPGQTRIFTVKANINSAAHELGKTLQIDVASVQTNATISGSFPLRGVTWTLGL